MIPKHIQEMTQLTDNIWAVEVPDDAQDITLSKSSISYWHINWNYPKGHRYTSGGFCFFYKMFGGKKKYPTNLTFLFTTKGATDGQWAQIVDIVDSHGRGFIFMNYENSMHVFSKASSSGRSLLRSKGCNTEKNYAILKRNDNGTE